MANYTEIAREALSLLAIGLIEQEHAIEQGKPESAVMLNPRIRQGWEKLSYVCCSRGKLPPRTFPELVLWLRQPVKSWEGIGDLFDLDEDADAPLLDNAYPSYLCEELGADKAGAYHTRMELEDENFRKLKWACHELNLAEDYSAAREFLIRTPVLTDVIAQLGANTKWHDVLHTLLRQCYGAIPESCVRTRGNQRVVYRCPHCGWVLEWKGNEAHCVQGSVCSAVKGDLNNSDDWLVYEDGMLRTKEGVQRYVVQPELSLIALFDELKSVRGVYVELFPDIDAYDLLIKFLERGERWAVDVKDVRNPSRLAKNLNDTPFVLTPVWDRAFYVFLDYRAAPTYLQRFQTHWHSQTRISFMKMRKFARLVKQTAKGET
jgi:hypothetical protein